MTARAPFALVLALSAVLAAGAAAAPRASLPDIEDEVMCPTCGVPLSHAFSPQADRERAFIRAQIAQGKDKQQIKDALVAEFGKGVLAEPRHEGFQLSAYIGPAVAIAIAAAALGFALARWRRAPADAPELPEPTPAEAARLERDLSRYDL
jgi:cytochrome c-type biogenesis protein CcmH